MPTFAFPLVPNCQLGPAGKPWFQSVRVKPIRAELTIDGEKVCTQFAPVNLGRDRDSPPER